MFQSNKGRQGRDYYHEEDHCRRGSVDSCGVVAVVPGAETLLDGAAPEATEVLVPLVEVDVHILPLLGRTASGCHVHAANWRKKREGG